MLGQILVGEEPDPSWESTAGELVRYAQMADDEWYKEWGANKHPLDDNFSAARNRAWSLLDPNATQPIGVLRSGADQFARFLFRTFNYDPAHPLDQKLQAYGFRDSVLTAWRSDPSCNALREESVVALRALRQVCFMFYKLEVPYATEAKERVIADFVKTDAELDYESSRLDNLSQAVLRDARKIILRVTANADPSQGIPKHGPGAVATGEYPDEKHLFKRYYRRLARMFPYDKWFLLNDSALCDQIQWLQTLEEHEAGTAKVVLVPKDSRGPRLISCEPLEYQWIQQALCRVLVDTIENHPLTRGRINFADQTRNRMLSLAGSHTPYKWVTLDMKEASDRVSLNLVRDLFNDSWYDHLYASRSDQTRLPDGTVVALKKFAPMGSAVCFPVESLIFWALSVATIMNTHNVPLRKAATNVYVYGDDIVCDEDYHLVLTQQLPKFSLMLNLNKCCIAGPFKESCGMDAFHGHSVTPTKIRSMLPIRPTSSGLQSWVAYSNAFHSGGLVQAAEHIRVELQQIMRSAGMHPIPTVSGGEPSVFAFVRPDCKLAVENSKRYIRYNTRLQRLEVLGYRYKTPSVKTVSEGWPLALRVLSTYESRRPDTGEVLKDTPPPKQLLTGQYPIAHRVKLQRAWTPAA